MRVVMVSPYDLGVPGGVQGQVQGLAASLRQLGHEVSVLAPGLPVGEHPGGVTTLGRAIGVRANGSVAPVAVSPLAARRAAGVLRRSGADVVHLHEPLAPAINYGCLLASDQPLVGTLHRSGGSVLYRALAPVARFALGRLAACCAVSEAARENVAGLVRGDVEVLFNGVDVARFAAAAPWPKSAPTVLFVGRHEHRKGLEVLLEAFAAAPDRAVLWVAGAGPETAELRRRHPPSDRVQWLGAIGDEEKAARMAGADVLCAPALGGESFGIVLLEGMAAGVAVVASDIDGYRQAAAGHARLVPPADPGALADALRAALADADGRRGRSSPEAIAAARGHAGHWSMTALAERYVEIYDRVRRPPGSGAPRAPG
jgi:phosphatidyl-myo-inositol alpha-mannosyltransferase